MTRSYWVFAATLILVSIVGYPVVVALDQVFGGKWWFLVALGAIIAALCVGLWRQSRQP
jgi:hypothetical protein